jgi:hypothetical protein
MENHEEIRHYMPYQEDKSIQKYDESHAGTPGSSKHSKQGIQARDTL